MMMMMMTMVKKNYDEELSLNLILECFLLLLLNYCGFCCMLLTTESRSARGASRHPAFMDGSLTVSQTRLPCPPCGKMRLQVLDCGDGNK